MLLTVLVWLDQKSLHQKNNKIHAIVESMCYVDLGLLAMYTLMGYTRASRAKALPNHRDRKVETSGVECNGVEWSGVRCAASEDLGGVLMKSMGAHEIHG